MRLKLIGTLILILAAAGCSAPISTPPPTELSEQLDLPPTTTPEMSLTSTFTPLPAASSTPTSTLTPQPAAPQRPDTGPSAIIARVEGGPNSFLLVGGSQNGGWVSASDVVDWEDFDPAYQLYTAFEVRDRVAGSEPAHELICDEYYLNLDSYSFSQSAVGVSGEWDVLPRIPSELSTDLEVYLRAITAWQVEQAPSQPIPAIDKIWLVDLEGDGVDEVFINGTRFAEPTGHDVEPRDYSVILMRKVIGSEVITIELVSDYYSEALQNQFPLTYTLEFIGDLNGDGRMEVLVGLSRWEGAGVMVFEINGAEAMLVLSVMCSL